MTSRIPTSSSERSYVGSVSETTALDTNAVSQEQRIVEVRPNAARTRAANKDERDATALLRSLDLDMYQQLISPKTYGSAMRDHHTYNDALGYTQFVLANSKEGWQRQAETADPAKAAEAALAAQELGAAEAVIAEKRKHGDTLTIYRHFAPKLG